MNIVLLLTACVNPNGMAFTALQDGEERLIQYIKSIKYYLGSTSAKIVVVENTNFNIQKYIDFSYPKEQLEFLYFDGNNYDKEKGKGYGEALILKYAFENSLFLEDADVVVKISGRYIASNLHQILFCIKQSNTVYANSSMIRGRKLCDSRLFAAPPSFYKKYFLPFHQALTIRIKIILSMSYLKLRYIGQNVISRTENFSFLCCLLELQGLLAKNSEF